MEKEERINRLRETASKYFYIFTRDGGVVEVERKGLSLEDFLKTIEDKGLIALGKTGTIINTVDITAIRNFLQYVNWINQRRPKFFIVDGKTKELLPQQQYWQEQKQFIKDFEKQKLLNKGQKYIKAKTMPEYPKNKKNENKKLKKNI